MGTFLEEVLYPYSRDVLKDLDSLRNTYKKFPRLFNDDEAEIDAKISMNTDCDIVNPSGNVYFNENTFTIIDGSKVNSKSHIRRLTLGPNICWSSHPISSNREPLDVWH